MIADEIDGADLGGGPFRDLEDHVDAVVVEINDLGVHLGCVHALAAVEGQNALDVSLHTRARINSARLELDFGCQSVVLDLLVPLKGHAAHDGILHHDDDDGRPLPPDADILKQAGGEQGLQGLVDFGGVVGVARGER